jgi:hypothetical protein
MIPRPLRHFLRLPPADRSLLTRAVVLVAKAKLALWVLPFNVARRLLTPADPRRSPIPFATTERIGWAVSRANHLVTRGQCLPQALAAESLLLRCGHPVEFRIGVVKTGERGLEAHAWVESGGCLVVGDLTQGLSAYSPLPPLPGARL